MIIIDTRERKTDLEQLLEIKGVKYKRQKLEVGDIALERDGKIIVAVERKTASDFLNSMIPVKRRDGTTYHRWTNQCERMLLQDYPTYVFVVGNITEALYELKQHVEISESFIYDNITSVLARYMIPIVLNIEDNIQFVDLVLSLFKQFEKGKDCMHIHLVKNRVTPSHLLRLFLPQKVAERLLAKYLTLANIAKASKSELQKVEGVGKMMADRIWRMFHE